LPAKTADAYVFRTDWLNIKKNLKFGKVSGIKSIVIDYSDEWTWTMGGDKKMSPKQREILTKMNQKRVDMRCCSRKRLVGRLCGLEKNH
jgi:hypothetical protein